MLCDQDLPSELSDLVGKSDQESGTNTQVNQFIAIVSDRSGSVRVWLLPGVCPGSERQREKHHGADGREQGHHNPNR